MNIPLTSLLILLVLCVGIGIFTNPPLSNDNERIQAGERVSFDQVVTGDGKGEMVGYYGWALNPDGKYWFSRHLYVNILSPVDIYDIALLANSCGYEAELITDPLEYDPFPPRAVIKHYVILYPNNVSLCFNVIVLDKGYITIEVDSDYYLRDDWMRTIFRKMLHDVNLPSSKVSQFKLAVNHLGFWN